MTAADCRRLGFIVVNGNSTLYGTLTGNRRQVLDEIDSNVPKKQGRGGQSALAFARLRMNAHEDYSTRMVELATQFFVDPNTKEPNVARLILYGDGGYKAYLSKADSFDSGLRAKILDVGGDSGASGGEQGFEEAIAKMPTID